MFLLELARHVFVEFLVGNLLSSMFLASAVRRPVRLVVGCPASKAEICLKSSLHKPCQPPARERK